jgi:hypothetical protein
MNRLMELVPVNASVDLMMEAMGEPDEMTADLNQSFQSPGLMPGPVVPEKPGGEQLNTVYALYYWRGRHDFLYFVLDQANEYVKEKGWYNAGE